MARSHIFRPARHGRIIRLGPGVLGRVPAILQSGPATGQDSWPVSYTPGKRTEVQLSNLHESRESTSDTIIVQPPTGPGQHPQTRLAEATVYLNFLYFSKETKPM
jgi:hypothetical protein